MTDADHDRTNKLALLIDAENIRVEFLSVVLREASALGTITVRRIYGHFAGDQMKGWHQAIHDHAMTPVHVQLALLFDSEGCASGARTLV